MLLVIFYFCLDCSEQHTLSFGAGAAATAEVIRFDQFAIRRRGHLVTIVVTTLSGVAASRTEGSDAAARSDPLCNN